MLLVFRRLLSYVNVITGSHSEIHILSHREHTYTPVRLTPLPPMNKIR